MSIRVRYSPDSSVGLGHNELKGKWRCLVTKRTGKILEGIEPDLKHIIYKHLPCYPKSPQNPSLNTSNNTNINVTSGTLLPSCHSTGRLRTGPYLAQCLSSINASHNAFFTKEYAPSTQNKNSQHIQTLANNSCGQSLHQCISNKWKVIKKKDNLKKFNIWPTFKERISTSRFSYSH